MADGIAGLSLVLAEEAHGRTTDIRSGIGTDVVEKTRVDDLETPPSDPDGAAALEFPFTGVFPD
jgi:hypothetical protein